MSERWIHHVLVKMLRRRGRRWQRRAVHARVSRRIKRQEVARAREELLLLISAAL